jgi:hypothetical protein
MGPIRTGVAKLVQHLLCNKAEICVVMLDLLSPTHFPKETFEEYENVLDQLKGLPPSLVGFYKHEAVRLKFGFGFLVDQSNFPDISGGANFFNPGPKTTLSPRDWPDMMYHPDHEASSFYNSCYAFESGEDGDLIAVRVKSKEEQPVVYLDHEKLNEPDLRPLANSFDEFIYEWERLCYVDIDLLKNNGAVDNDDRLDHLSEFGHRIREFIGIDLGFFKN